MHTTCWNELSTISIFQHIRSCCSTCLCFRKWIRLNSLDRCHADFLRLETHGGNDTGTGKMSRNIKPNPSWWQIPIVQMLNVLMKVTKPWCLMDSKYFLITAAFKAALKGLVSKGTLHQLRTWRKVTHRFSAVVRMLCSIVVEKR